MGRACAAGAMTFTANRASLALQRKGCKKDSDLFLCLQLPLLASLKQNPEVKGLLLQVNFIKVIFVGPGHGLEG